MFAAVDPSILELWMSEGGTVGWLGVDEQPLAVFCVADQPRPEATQAVRQFKVPSFSYPFCLILFSRWAACLKRTWEGPVPLVPLTSHKRPRSKFYW